MAYIGRGLDKISNVEKLDNLTFDGSSTSFALQKGGSSFVPSSANNILLSIDGVVQAGNFTVSGSTIDFGVAPLGSSTCDFILHYGVGLITTPADGSVTTAKIQDSSVTTAKIQDSSVSLAKLTATGTKDATTFLRGDNTFASAGGTNTPNFSAYRSTNQTISNATDTIVAYNVEVFDTDSAFDTANGKFTVPSGKGGKYMFVGQTQWNSATDFDDTNISICVNGTRIFYGDVGRNEFYRTNRVVALLNLSASDYVEIKVFQAVGSDLDIQGSTGDRSYFYGYKIIE